MSVIDPTPCIAAKETTQRMISKQINQGAHLPKLPESPKVHAGPGVWLHLTEQHSHEHIHEPLEHEHEHIHDEHHQHGHGEEMPPGTKHAHRHRHDALVHRHP